MKTKHIAQLSSFLLLTLLYGAVIYILGNGMYKETLDDETTMVWMFMALAGITVMFSLLFFIPFDEPKKN